MCLLTNVRKELIKMKKWLKENTLAIVGNIFIWILPLVLCLIMSFGGTKEQTPISFKISLWGDFPNILLL